MVNRNKLKGRMREMDYTYDKMSEVLGITTATFANKINGRSRFYEDEMHLIMEELQLTKEEAVSIFFAD